MRRVPVAGPDDAAAWRAMRRILGRALGALLPLVLLHWALAAGRPAPDILDGLNTLLPIWFIAVTSVLGYRMARRVEGAIWTPLVWFPVQSALFYGFGPLVELFGNEFTQARLASHYLSVTPEQLLRAHRLSVTGIFMVLAGLWLHLALRRRAWARHGAQWAPAVRPLTLGIAFVVIGGLFRYAILNPASWNLIDLTVPGVLTSISQLVDLGFAILAFCAARRSQRARLIMLTLYPCHVLLSVLSLSKMEIVIALLLPAIGAFMAHRRPGRLFVNVLACAGMFVLAQDYVHYGRQVIHDSTGTITDAGYGTRAAILADYVTLKGMGQGTGALRHGGVGTGKAEAYQGWWTRLSFAGAQARVMERFDSGAANPQLGAAWVYFIPRTIWPDKPILHGPGLALYRMLSGNAAGNSFLGLSIYGDLYWQYGWRGVVIGGLCVGWFLGILSAVSLGAVRRQEFIMIPFVLLVLKVGLLSPNKFILNGFIGPAPILLFYFLAITLAIRLRRGGRRRVVPLVPMRRLTA